VNRFRKLRVWQGWDCDVSLAAALLLTFNQGVHLRLLEATLPALNASPVDSKGRGNKWTDRPAACRVLSLEKPERGHISIRHLSEISVPISFFRPIVGI